MEKGKKRKPSFVNDKARIWVPGMESPQLAGEYRKTLAEAKQVTRGIEREEKVKEFLQMLVEDTKERQSKAGKGAIVVIRPKNVRGINDAFKERHDFSAGIALGYLKRNGYMVSVKTGVLGFTPKALELLGIQFGEVPSEPTLGEEEEKTVEEGLEELSQEEPEE